MGRNQTYLVQCPGFYDFARGALTGRLPSAPVNVPLARVITSKHGSKTVGKVATMCGLTYIPGRVMDST